MLDPFVSRSVENFEMSLFCDQTFDTPINHTRKNPQTLFSFPQGDIWRLYSMGKYGFLLGMQR